MLAGLGAGRLNLLIACVAAAVIVLAMNLVGSLLVSALIVFPALTAMRLFKSFRGVILCAAVTSVAGFCAGLTISFTLSTPVGATVVAVDLAMFLLSCLLRALAVRR